MKRIAFVLPVFVLIFLGACTLRMSATETPAAIVLSTQAPGETTASAATVMAPVETVAPAAQPSATAGPVPTEVPPSGTPSPATQEVQSAAGQPTATQPAASQATASQAAPTATLLPGTTFDPNTAYGTPTYENPMDFPNYWEWAPPETDTLPDNQRIRLQFKDGELYVTGKRPEFSTWWFSSHFLSDAYMQLTFNTEDCSGDDAYGMIFRGPQHLAGVSYGYVVSFTCDGKLGVFRLDDAEPWDVDVLLDEEAISAINAGPGEQNVLGVHAMGDQFAVYANGVKVAEFEDDHFAKGRMGVFVRAANSNAYTYRVTNLAYWILGEGE